VRRRTEAVSIRGEAARDVEVLETRHGPVICGDPARGTALTLKSVQFAETDLSFDCLPRMLRAGTVEALFEATRGWGLIDHNLLAADTAGRTGWLLRARVPRRGRENGWLPVPGWTGEHEWRGWIPFEEMPRALDPAPGFLATANNRPVADGHPDYLCTDCHPPYRARRVAELLADPALRSVDGAAAIHADTLSPAGDECIAGSRGFQRRARRRCARILAWDARMEAAPDAAAATSPCGCAVRRFGRRAGSRGGPPVALAPPGVAPLTQLWWALPRPAARGRRGAAARHELGRAAAGRAGPRWPPPRPPRPGARCTARALSHPLSALFPEAAPMLDPPAEPLAGDGDTVQANGLIAPLGPRAAYGALARYSFDVGAWENSRWSVFLGASGHPGSPHYADQHAMWAACAMALMRADWAALEAAGTRQALEPR
jgi:penicillin amidase